MKYNRHNIKEGDTVILDEGFRNSSTVKVLYITAQDLFSCIAPAELQEPYKEGEYWDVMTCRLSPLKQKVNDTN